jgi:hypothetical protein
LKQRETKKIYFKEAVMDKKQQQQPQKQNPNQKQQPQKPNPATTKNPNQKKGQF